MESVELKKDIAVDLVDTKLNLILSDINEILARWEYKSTSKFVSDARNGTIEEAEEDAITLRHLLDQREQLLKIKASWI